MRTATVVWFLGILMGITNVTFAEVVTLETQKSSTVSPLILSKGNGLESPSLAQTQAANGKTVDLVCRGDVRSRTIIIGKVPLEPSTHKANRNYYFLNGRLINASGRSESRLVDFQCFWSKGEINCNHEIAPKACVDAYSEGVIRPELSFCRNSLTINRYDGVIKDFHYAYSENQGLGRVIWEKEFEGTCESAPKQKF